MPDLVSSNIASADYNDETGEMTITFKSGQTYSARAPKETYESFIASPSPGSFFHRQLKTQFSWSPE
jgi:hypothetical protein